MLWRLRRTDGVRVTQIQDKQPRTGGQMRGGLRVFRTLPIATGIKAFVASIVLLVCQAFVLIGLTFQPGWANGWPLGISKHSVFAAAVTIVRAAMSLTMVGGLSALAGANLERIVRRPYVGYAVIAAALIGTLFIASAVLPGVYSDVRNAISIEWP
ncbi:hypothetical protein [Stratiformator vulcanicus]|uniref:Uncharacterized protein n=1 Tax=Stratiformator vulcanicus TaxID=2527980 RepID=A0A517QXL3_9PLAN|nr:hypothetical protein [Stratiformator vulcanicus]QDT36333.1 hypothetical protein Pan189_06890 [Stratiformator vulcanicus]